MYHTFAPIGKKKRDLQEVRDGLQLLENAKKIPQNMFTVPMFELLERLDRHFAVYGGLKGIIGNLDERVKGNEKYRI